ncbi:MAG: hypothetical protein EOO63_07860 [Hymenobacter sp.]|nr:MAG: hypothetical protein EOO63_07860 [Hymenobacter sp.]
MKTLKLQLLAASMFAFAAAHAQGVPPAAPAAPAHTSPTPNPQTGLGTAGRDRASYQTPGSSTNDAVIYQSISGQYANINQTAGTAGGNSADIYQLDGSDNNANITQTNTSPVSFLGRNEARIDQFGYTNTSDQVQTGGANRAYSVQGAGVRNSSTTQTQEGIKNDAYINQQSGENNYASQSQRNMFPNDGNSAEIIQRDTNGSTALQTQQGRSNVASTMQTGASSYSEIIQGGGQNQAFVNQK